MKTYGKITAIEEVENYKTRPIGPMTGNKGAHRSLASNLNHLTGRGDMDGYRVTCKRYSETTEIVVLIDNGQGCCENWGYFASEDDFASFIGTTLLKVELVDTACKKSEVRLESMDLYEPDIQFVDFVTNKGTFQLTVYNEHNGYYGHGVVVAVNGEVIHEDTL